MSALSLRIRRARTLASISQNELAHRVGVKRSAVSQWECPTGTIPSVEHLINIAIQTDVSFEWIATGRGSASHDQDATPVVVVGDYAMDHHESKALALLRHFPDAKKQLALQLLDVLAR
jgi:transcriptional regulator with XRE-family HTH domain